MTTRITLGLRSDTAAGMI